MRVVLVCGAGNPYQSDKLGEVLVSIDMATREYLQLQI